MSRHIEDEAKAVHPAISANGRDDKAWAKRIIYREERGDKTLTTLQVQFAKMALGLIPNKTDNRG